MPKKNMGLKRKNLTGYMGGGVFKSKAPVSSSFRSGGATEVGTEKKVQSYKEYAKKMFGGGFSTHDYRQAPPLTGGAVMPDRPTRGVRIPRVVGTAPLTGGPGFQPTKADDRGYAGGGTLDSMRKKIIGIKKDRGLTAKSGARKGMTKKRVTRRGGG